MNTETERAEDQAAGVAELIEALGAQGGTTARDARERLVKMGSAAEPALIAALDSPNTQRRWEAGKALGDIGTPGSSERLARLLQDDDGGVRWVAADALIAIGPSALPAVLRALIDHSESAVMREGAHHILRAFSENKRVAPLVAPILSGLEGPAAPVACLAPAEDALRTLA